MVHTINSVATTSVYAALFFLPPNPLMAPSPDFIGSRFFCVELHPPRLSIYSFALYEYQNDTIVWCTCLFCECWYHSGCALSTKNWKSAKKITIRRER